MRAGGSRQSWWQRCAALAAGLALAGCPAADGPPPAGSTEAGVGEAAASPAPRTAAPTRVRLGVEVLLDDSLHLVRGRRVGLITNHTGVSSRGTTIDLLHEHPEIELVALFGPEHGIRGDAAEGELVEDGVDPRTGVPVHSLYGGVRAPEAEHLAGLDVLLFDIQDVGARYYTYVWTMSLAMEAAGRAEIPFVVLDRPNPIGAPVQGNVLDPAFATFVGLHAVPMRHGLTPGELARVLRGEFGVDAELHVAPLDGWAPRMGFDAPGLAWRAPSPNMPSIESALHYPGSCLFEGTNLSVGRGTPDAFQQVGAPWLDGEAMATALNERALPGVRFEAVHFTPDAPTDGKFGGEQVSGVRFVATDAEVYDPTVAAVAALVEARRLAGDDWRWNVAHFDRLAGTDALRLGIEAGRSVEELTASWPSQTAAFRALAAPYLIYAR